MQREEKQLEMSLDMLTTRLNELKCQLHALLYKIQHERDLLTWPTFLDNFALISGQFAAISKILLHEKTPLLRNYTILPLYLSPDKDEELMQMTERRIPVFNHDIVPDYLRTKLEPDIEMKIQQYIHKANGLGFDPAQKQMTAFNKVLNNVLDIIGKTREDWENEAGARAGIGQTSSLNDTHTLVSVVSTGKSLKPMVVPAPPPGMMIAPQPPSGPMNPNQQPPPNMGVMNKAPANIKTSIKSASQMNNPYQR